MNRNIVWLELIVFIFIGCLVFGMCTYSKDVNTKPERVCEENEGIFVLPNKSLIICLKEKPNE